MPGGSPSDGEDVVIDRDVARAHVARRGRDGLRIYRKNYFLSSSMARCRVLFTNFESSIAFAKQDTSTFCSVSTSASLSDTEYQHASSSATTAPPMTSQPMSGSTYEVPVDLSPGLKGALINSSDVCYAIPLLAHSGTLGCMYSAIVHAAHHWLTVQLRFLLNLPSSLHLTHCHNHHIFTSTASRHSSKPTTS